MRLPSKVTPYSSSIVALFPIILETLTIRDMTPNELLEQIRTDRFNMGDFLSALDCLFALGKIELIEGRVRCHS